MQIPDSPTPDSILEIVERAQELSALGMSGDVRVLGEDIYALVTVADPVLAPYVPEFTELIVALARLG